MEIVPIQSMNRDEWDHEICRFDNSLLFNRSPWLSFLEETQKQKIIRLKIIDNRDVKGYLAGMLINKWGLRVLGSPLSVWLTDSMGPVVNDDFDQDVFLESLDRLRRNLRIHSLEIGSPCLVHQSMQRNGFKCHEKTVYEIPLSANQDTMWQSLSSKCRNRIRKGLQNNLVVECCNDPNFVEEFYDEMREVFSRQATVPIYPIHVMRSLFKNLLGNKMLLALRVKHGDRTIASGLFPHDDRFILSFGIASRTDSLHLCPNELLYWDVISRAGKMGLKTFRIGSIYRQPPTGGIFKKKFNGNEVILRRYSKDYTFAASLGRKLYRPVYYFGKKLRNRMTPA